MAELTTEQLRSLEQIRQRLLSLNAALGALRTDLATSLPSWSTFQSHANLVSSTLQQINSQLSDHQDLLATTVTFPSMQYPGRYQADVIQMLLRTKLEPDVEEWVEQGQSYARDLNTTAQVLRDRDRRELWQWAPSAANMEARKQKWGADYTLAEVEGGVEKVVTGLRRELVVPAEDIDDEDEFDSDDDGDEVEDEDGEEEVMDVDAKPDSTRQSLLVEATASASSHRLAPQMPLESVHKFMTTGKVA